MSVDLYAAGRSEHHTALNVANGNFIRLMELIGVELVVNTSHTYGVELMGTIYELAPLRERVAIIRDSARTMPDLVCAPPRELSPEEAATAPGLDPLSRALAAGLGARVIQCGWSPEYIEIRLTGLLKLIDFAIAEGQPLRYS